MERRGEEGEGGTKRAGKCHADNSSWAMHGIHYPPTLYTTQPQQQNKSIHVTQITVDCKDNFAKVSRRVRDVSRVPHIAKQ